MGWEDPSWIHGPDSLLPDLRVPARPSRVIITCPAGLLNRHLHVEINDFWQLPQMGGLTHIALPKLTHFLHCM